MKLIELLHVLSGETLVGIWNIDDKRSKCPTPQTYQKVKNIPFSKISNIYLYEVMNVCVVEENGGLLIRIYDKERLNRSLNNMELAKYIKNG